jgi:hypothetical protein
MVISRNGSDEGNGKKFMTACWITLQSDCDAKLIL